MNLFDAVKHGFIPQYNYTPFIHKAVEKKSFILIFSTKILKIH